MQQGKHGIAITIVNLIAIAVSIFVIGVWIGYSQGRDASTYLDDCTRIPEQFYAGKSVYICN